MASMTCGPIDFVFLQDLSGSFADDLPMLKAQFPNLIATVEGIDAHVDFAMASFIDKPTGGFGSGGDEVYKTHLGLSADNAAVTAAVNAMDLGGADAPEAQLEGLLQTVMRTAEMGYRGDSTPIVMLTTDSSYHVAGDLASQPTNDRDTSLDGMAPGTGEGYPTIDALRATYEGLVAQSGFGAIVTLTSHSTNFSDAVRTAIGAACGTITHPGTDNNDTITGTGRDDGPYGGLGTDDLSGDDGNDVVDGGASNDLCHGGRDDDILRGGSGDDALVGAAGANTLCGGAGADIFVQRPGDGADTIADFGDGIDLIDLTDVDKVTATLALKAITVNAGDDAVITLGGGLKITLTGIAPGQIDLKFEILDPANVAPLLTNDAATTTGMDPVTIDVPARDSDVAGGAISVTAVSATADGTATLNSDGTVTCVATAGFLGRDSFSYLVSDGAARSVAWVNVTVGKDLSGSEGDDDLIGTAADETMEGFSGNDYIAALTGADSILGGAGDDTVDGDIGRDRIDGTGGDTITGKGGDDILFGQDGDDSSVFWGDFGHDLVGDGISGLSDEIVLSDLMAADILLSTNTAETMIRTGFDDVICTLGANDVIDGEAGQDDIEGGNGKDKLYGDRAFVDRPAGDADIIYGGRAGQDSGGWRPRPGLWRPRPGLWRQRQRPDPW